MELIYACYTHVYMLIYLILSVYVYIHICVTAAHDAGLMKKIISTLLLKKEEFKCYVHTFLSTQADPSNLYE